MFKPVNRYIQIDLPRSKPRPTSSIVLPEDFKPAEEHHITAEVVAYASDIRFKDQLVMCGGEGASVIVDKSMINESHQEMAKGQGVICGWSLRARNLSSLVDRKTS